MAFPHRSVRRVVQDVELWMPWSHRLPDYADIAPGYGQNLVELAARLAAADPAASLAVIDVGANIGDSTKQILQRTRARVLAVEADEYYLGYLRRNVGALAEVTIAPVLLTTGADDARAVWSPVRRGGTTHFRTTHFRTTEGAPGAGAQQTSSGVAVADLPTRYPDFTEVRLVKSDTDGHDTELVPALARTFAGSTPVLFFEFDTGLTRTVAGRDAHDVWPELKALGYDTIGLWNHAGDALSRCSVDEAAATTTALLADSARPTPYLDVVAVHHRDAAGRAAVADLIGGRPR